MLTALFRARQAAQAALTTFRVIKLSLLPALPKDVPAADMVKNFRSVVPRAHQSRRGVVMIESSCIGKVCVSVLSILV